MLNQQVPLLVKDVLGAQPDSAVRSRVVIVFRALGIAGDRLSDRYRDPTGTDDGAVREHGALAVENGIARERRVDAVVGNKRAFDVVDVAALVIVVERGTQCELAFDDRYIQHRFEGVAVLTAGRHGPAAVDARLELVEHGLVRDQSYRACHRAGAVKSALRTRQNLDPLHVGYIDVEIATADRHRLFV